MAVVSSIRDVLKRSLGVRGLRLVRVLLHGKYLDLDRHLAIFEGKRALEIGGPSEIFCDQGSVPVYSLLGNVDNCLFSDSTIWSGAVVEGGPYHFQVGTAPGTQFICEGASLEGIPSSGYDLILSSHSLEHMANPLQALVGWKRVLKAGGCLLLILPHKDQTFDWRRSITPLAHMIRDYEQKTGEDDLTHLPEILELHDLSRDKAAGTKEQFEARCRNNSVVRGMHHHVFNTPTAVALLDQAGFQLVNVGAHKPENIVLLARKPIQQADNSEFLHSGAEYIERSPFPSDYLSCSSHGEVACGHKAPSRGAA